MYKLNLSPNWSCTLDATSLRQSRIFHFFSLATLIRILNLLSTSCNQLANILETLQGWYKVEATLIMTCRSSKFILQENVFYSLVLLMMKTNVELLCQLRFTVYKVIFADNYTFAKISCKDLCSIFIFLLIQIGSSGHMCSIHWVYRVHRSPVNSNGIHQALALYGPLLNAAARNFKMQVLELLNLF
jgi:hypothetical protein